jgi:hypothetical protein
MSAPLRRNIKLVDPLGGAQDGRPDPVETLVPESEYEIAYVSEEKFSLFRRQVWAVTFQIVEGEHAERQLYAFYNIPPLRDGRTPSATLSRAYEAVTDLRPPRKIARYRPSEFLNGCVVLAAVRTVARDIRGRERPPNARHSVVDQLIRRISGAPPLLRRRKT